MPSSVNGGGRDRIMATLLTAAQRPSQTLFILKPTTAPRYPFLCGGRSLLGSARDARLAGPSRVFPTLPS